jgi:hypothetical protein
MKSRLIVPILLIAFLAAPAVVSAQNSKDKKINRELRKIEKHSRKLQELQGMDYQAIADEAIASVNTEDIDRIREEALAQAEETREQARQTMDEQREAMREQREAMREQRKEMEEQMVRLREKGLVRSGELKELKGLKLEEFDDVRDVNGKKFHYYYKTPKFEFKSGEPIVIDVPDVKVDIPEFKSGNLMYFSNSENNLSINKNLTGDSSSADFTYEVKEGTNGMSLNVNGAIDAGKVKIVIKRPDGEVYNEYTLSPLANVNWKQTISFDDQEENKNIGKWTVTVSAEGAKGTYGVQINGR